VDSNVARSALELAGVSLRRRLRCGRVSGVRERKEEMDASTSPGVSLWRSCGRPELTSRARDGVRMPNVAAAVTPVGHVDELGVHSDKAMVD